ncbi:MAG: hydrogenase nickel incorporation protein HypA [Elusimicrobia bacterium]|nr:hydrogenase nickel incorporation protein HypA [Elusimicrobiota bacterium]
MHEMSLISGLFRKIGELASEHQAKRVVKVQVKLGAFSHISADHFREHFEQGARGTICEASQLLIDESKDTKDPHAQDILLQSIEIESQDGETVAAS